MLFNDLLSFYSKKIDFGKVIQSEVQKLENPFRFTDTHSNLQCTNLAEGNPNYIYSLCQINVTNRSDTNNEEL